MGLLQYLFIRRRRTEYQTETKTQNTVETLVRVFNQDHTLANLLRIPLGANPHVESCGYKHRDPFDDFVSMVIVTKRETTAQEAIQDASQHLLQDIQQLEHLIFDTLFA